MLVFAHRGRHASHSFPDNSLEAIDTALRAGRDGVEIDVRRSADGVPVLWHDRTAGDRLAEDLTHAELSRHAGYAVPDLGTVLTRFAGPWFDVEMKTAGALDASSAALLRADARKLVVTSFRHDVIVAAAARLTLPFGAILSHCPASAAAGPWHALAATPVRTLVWDFECASAEMFAAARAAGFRSLAWNVAAAADRAAAAGMALDGIIVDT